MTHPCNQRVCSFRDQQMAAIVEGHVEQGNRVAVRGGGSGGGGGGSGTRTSLGTSGAAIVYNMRRLRMSKESTDGQGVGVVVVAIGVQNKRKQSHWGVYMTYIGPTTWRGLGEALVLLWV